MDGILWALLGLLLICGVMVLALLLYLSLLCYASSRLRVVTAKKKATSGLTASELAALPEAFVEVLVKGMECAVCLEEIEVSQRTRLLPVCNHIFHQPCIDEWLSAHPVCPLCRLSLHRTTPQAVALQPLPADRPVFTGFLSSMVLFAAIL